MPRPRSWPEPDCLALLERSLALWLMLISLAGRVAMPPQTGSGLLAELMRDTRPRAEGSDDPLPVRYYCSDRLLQRPRARSLSDPGMDRRRRRARRLCHQPGRILRRPSTSAANPMGAVSECSSALGDYQRCRDPGRHLAL